MGQLCRQTVQLKNQLRTEIFSDMDVKVSLHGSHNTSKGVVCFPGFKVVQRKRDP